MQIEGRLEGRAPSAPARWPALLWALMLLLVLAHHVALWQRDPLPVEADLLALLPSEARRPAPVEAALLGLSAEASRDVIVLVGASDPAEARWAAAQVRDALEAIPSELQAQPSSLADLPAMLAFYAPWRDRLLTESQRVALASGSSTQWGELALQSLYQPAGLRLGPWAADPLGLWPQWWAERAAGTRVILHDDGLWLEAEDRHWLLLRYRTRHAGLAASGEAGTLARLQRLRSQFAEGNPEVALLAAGVPLFAEAAASRAQLEVSIIGLGSLLAVVALVWWCLRSLRPVLLVSLSLIVGCLVALSVTVALFGQVHLLTLVFGATLVGVAEDYGFHYFAARQGVPVAQRRSMLRRLLPGLLLALGTSGIAYLAMGIAPFPGLRQMAVFSVVGLIAAFMTVLCWFPWLDQRELPAAPMAERFGRSLLRWPRWPGGWRGRLMLGGLIFAAALAATGLSHRDDVRLLYSVPPGLLLEQQQVSAMLDLPGAAQLLLVEGADPQALLEREEVLTSALQVLRGQGTLTGWSAVSDWLPSLRRQMQAQTLTRDAELAALAQVRAITGEAPDRQAHAATPLLPEVWLHGPLAAPLKSQWLGVLSDARHYSVVLLKGLRPDSVPALRALAASLPGVSWVDRSGEATELLARYRVVMSGLLGVGFMAVLLALSWRFGRQAWRALLPTALGTLLTLAVFSVLGVPLQLFHILALLVLLGMGVDFGIFILEHPGDGRAWVAVALAGVSTLLSFGLLALSSTPALHAFGLTMLIGETLIWFLTPLFRLPDPNSEPS